MLLSSVDIEVVAGSGSCIVASVGSSNSKLEENWAEDICESSLIDS